MAEIYKAFKEIYVCYLQRNFRITVLHVDGEFAPLQPLIESIPGGPQVNLTSADEHVPDIEQRIRVVKERTRAVRHSLPYRRIPVLLMIHMVLNCVKLLNYSPPKGGVSAVINPKTIMSEEKLGRPLISRAGKWLKYTRRSRRSMCIISSGTPHYRPACGRRICTIAATD